MTPKQFASEMLKISVGEPPTGRSYQLWVREEMDALMVQVLREMGYGRGCDIFEETAKWE